MEAKYRSASGTSTYSKLVVSQAVTTPLAESVQPLIAAQTKPCAEIIDIREVNIGLSDDGKCCPLPSIAVGVALYRALMS